jgi:hypothetical protein
LVTRYFKIVIILWVFWVFLICTAMADAQKKQRLLILHSYHAGLTWTEGQDRGLREIFEPHGDIEIFTEYLDAKRIPLNEILVPFAAFLGRKYPPDFFDAVVVESPNRFMIDHRVLDRFGMDENLLPPSAIVSHKSFSVYQA